ncbi:PRD domain-containing protein [Enterococcus crotali]|uniref:PRD domain-containing protein n=1 Tax=Enterococcus crotali TaxID=1453587 RepID=UPI000470B550|nr:PRD domain-containing protein [Enterococcus crotali]
MIGKKLEILKDSKIIDEETEQFVLTVNNYLLEQKVINNEEHLDMFLTHIAMADARQKKNEPVIGMDELILSEIQNDEKLAESKALWQELSRYCATTFSQEELWFIYMHIINLLKKEQ